MKKYLCLLLITLIILLAACQNIKTDSIVHVSNGSSSEESTAGIKEEIELNEYMSDIEDFSSGYLQLLHTGSAQKSANELKLMRDQRPKNASGDPLYYLQETAKYYADSTALWALNQMVQAFYNKTQDNNLLIRYALDPFSENYDAEFRLGTAFTLNYYNSAPNNAPISENHTLYKWFYENCAQYGFIVRYPYAEEGKETPAYGKNVFRYVGVPHATYMMNQKISLEEYISYLRNNCPTYENRITVVGADGQVYAMYYCKKSETPMKIRIPNGHAYEVSGDGEQGYIILLWQPRINNSTGSNNSTEKEESTTGPSGYPGGSDLNFRQDICDVYAVAGAVNIRSAANYEDNYVVATAKFGERLQRIKYNDIWTVIAYGGMECYVATKYLTTDKGEVTFTDVTPKTIYVTTEKTMNLRTYPYYIQGDDSNIYTAVKNGQKLTQTGVSENGKWIRVTYTYTPEGKTEAVTAVCYCRPSNVSDQKPGNGSQNASTESGFGNLHPVG